MDRGAGGPERLERCDLVVIGAGAAGLLAATFAARAGADVLVLETTRNPGAKIRVSGGGRCNLLPSRFELDDFWTTGSITALRNIVTSWPLAAVRKHFEGQLGIELVDEPTGKVFPASGRARDVSDALLADARRAGTEIRTGARVVRIGIVGEDVGEDATRFRLQAEAGMVVRARRVVLATGGLSLPKTGSDGAGYRFARDLGHSVRTPHPALVPLLAEDFAWGDLAGISVTVAARAVRDGEVLEQRRGDFLFTHRGFSGPVVLDLSRHFTAPDAGNVRLRIGWGGLAAAAWDDVLRRPGGGTVAGRLRGRLPHRLADVLLRRAGLAPDAHVAFLTREARRRLVAELADGVLEIAGSEGYRTAEVTGGGVPLAEVRPRTLESRRCPGLYFAGEILDATGHLGGHNFLWAWVSGHAAGRGAAESLSRVRTGRRRPAAGDRRETPPETRREREP